MLRSHRVARTLGRRNLWTRVTATGPTVSDCVQAATAQLPSKQPDLCVALVSKSFDSYGLGKALAQVNPKHAVGCVVDHVPGARHGVSLLLAYDEKVVPFHVWDSPERPKVRSISVGRWGRPDDFDRLRFQGNRLDDKGWDAFGTISRPARDFDLPEPLTRTDEAPSFVFLASDNEPDHLLHALDHQFPDAAKLGIIGASTPFVNGTPYMLFSDHQEVGAGIVGFACYSNPSGLSMQVEHDALEPLGEPMTITRCRGNIILDLDQAGATGLLLELIRRGQSANIAKDQEFYLGMHHSDTLDPQQMTVSRITSGDPSRGNMSIDTTADLKAGQVVQFMTRKKSVDVLTHADASAMTFGVVDKDHTIDAAPLQRPAECKVYENVFGGASENGLILGKPSMESHILDVPHSVVRVSPPR